MDWGFFFLVYCIECSCKLLWPAFHCTGAAGKQIVHHLESEALSRCFKLLSRLFQCVFGLIIFIYIVVSTVISTYPHKTLSPSLIKVVTFDTNDKVV